MRDAIEKFRDDYTARYASGVRGFLTRHGRKLCRELHGALSRPRSTVYLFGNGGSYAIGKCIEFALQRYAAARGLALRVRTGVDVHRVNWLDAGDNPGTPFVDVLRAEGADERDLVVLISGSGDSDNLCEAASYAARLSIPTLALVGSARGRLCGVVPPSRSFPTPFEDQQISEDIIQSLAHVLEWSAPVGRREEEWDEAVAGHAEALTCALRRILADFISAAAAAAVSTFRRGRFILVSGFDHPALSVCAEHTAHNLYWDSVYEVESPPDRLIRSSPTACDFSGISNDRRRRFISHLTGAGELDGGLALIYSMRLDSPGLAEVLERLDAGGVPTLVLAADGELTREYAHVNACTTGLDEPQAQAGVSQAFGHVLGRVTRLLLLLERDVGRGDRSGAAAARFLIERDLAQRRLLNG